MRNFKKRLDEFQLGDPIIQSGLDRIRRAFKRSETELMITSFPSSFCTDAAEPVALGDLHGLLDAFSTPRTQNRRSWPAV